MLYIFIFFKAERMQLHELKEPIKPKVYFSTMAFSSETIQYKYIPSLFIIILIRSISTI